MTYFRLLRNSELENQLHFLFANQLDFCSNFELGRKICDFGMH